MTGDGGRTRIESDTLGEMPVPADSLYGAQTARAVANFQISGWRVPARFLRTLAVLKAEFARANGRFGLIDGRVGAAIAGAAEEVASGRHLEHFPVDVFQTGSATSTNMNMNEVVAALARRGLHDGTTGTATSCVHPNDHVNLGQSSNDVIPSALRACAALSWRDELAPALAGVSAELFRLAEAHRGTVTLGRTHLMDAVPTTYGRVFTAWRHRLEGALGLAAASAARLLPLPLGGTAVGSGIGGDGRVVSEVVAGLAARTGLGFSTMVGPAAGIAAQDEVIAHADALAGIGRVLLAVANDIRMRASGPFGGLGELRLPAVQPGSSIMPGKVNPVVAEATALAALEVEGLASACRASATLHQLDLSHAQPLLIWNLDAMTELLAGSGRMLAARCLAGLEVDIARARSLAERSPALATALAREIGYERAAEVAKAAENSGETVATVALRMGVLDPAVLRRVLDLDRLAGAATA
ncbi:MAG: lyase family protein [Acidobacteriota bacterium]